MMLIVGSAQRQARHDLWLGGSTAAVAGFVNVCSVIAFFAFSSNVTGHFAIFAEEIVKGHWHQVSVVCVWLGLFLTGAFLANLSITAVGVHRPYLGRLLPLTLELGVLSAIGYYGHHHYGETLRETEYLVGGLLFAMGLQNSLVTTISGGVVKTTHLTGLLTDMGVELAMFLQRRFRGDAVLRFKLKLRFVIVSWYLVGGVAGGITFQAWGFPAFYLATATLSLILTGELASVRRSLRRAEPDELRSTLEAEPSAIQ
jgi:uncharacterized membrane protein YoaK (UPF0700 family)